MCDITIIKQEVVPELGHAFGTYFSDGNATCQADGTKTAQCTRDGCTATTTTRDTGSKKDHTYVATTIDPTCTAKGYTLYVCVCNYSYFDNYVDTISHVFDKEVVCVECLKQNATCTQPAQYYKTCECGKIGTESFDYGDTIAHTYSEDWTYDSTAHWHEAVCGCDILSDYSAHQNVNGFCSTCNRPLNTTVGVVYDLSADGTYAEVIGYEGTDTTVVIAEEYQGKPVTVIYDEAFYNNDNITSVVLPDNLVTIGYSAFYSCSSLTSVVIGDSVTSIGSYAFDNCNRLTSVDIGDSVTSIGDWAFDNCDSLTSVVIPDGVTSIGSYAFRSCSSLTSVVIGDSVTSIGYSAFSDCSSLQFNVHNNVKYLASKTNNYFAVIGSVNTNLSSITIHNYAKIIANHAFYSHTRLTSVVIPDSVTSIGDSAFNGCSSLTSVDIGDSVTTIGNSAFSGCSSLTSINYLGTIDQWAEISFSNNTANPIYYTKQLKINGVVVTEVNLTSATKVSSYVFYNCSSLTSVVIGENVTAIGYSAFYNCSSLTSVYYKSSVVDWQEITIDSLNANLTSATRYYYSEEHPTAEGNYWHYVDGVVAVWCYSPVTDKAVEPTCTKTGLTEGSHCSRCGDTLVTQEEIPALNHIVVVDEKVEPTCTKTGLTEGSHCSRCGEVFVAQNIVPIQQHNFIKSICNVCGTSNLSFILNSTGQAYTVYGIGSCTETEIIIPASFKGKPVTYIRSSAFEDCYRLTSVVIPDSVTEIGDYAFLDCSSLTSIKYRGTPTQWSEITMGSYWDSNTGNYSIKYNYTGN